jgi:hypothetical protein
MIGSTIRRLLAVMSLFAAGCAVAPMDADAESTGTTGEAILIRLQHVSLKLDAGVHRVATASGTWGMKEVQYLSFRVTNTGTTNAAASQLAITCDQAVTPLNFNPMCTAQPIIAGLPAIPAGGFYDFSWPNRALEIGSGTDSNVWVPSGMALDETITAALQSSSQIVDSTIGTVVLHDSCADNAACAAIPAGPTTPPSGQGLLGSPLQFGYLYSWITPTWLSTYAFDASVAPLGTNPIHGGEPLRIDSALLEPMLGWSGVGTAETARVYLDGVQVFTPTLPATGSSASVYVNAPAYDTLTHSIRVTFAGDGALAPTVSRTFSFTLVP